MQLSRLPGVFLDPHADAAGVCRRLAFRQFGESAGEFVLGAWQALEQAQARLSVACTWSPGQWPMWYAGRAAGPVPGTGAMDELRRSQLPARPAGDIIYNPADFVAALQAVADAWREALPHYAAAARLLVQAESVAASAPLHNQSWWSGTSPSPTRREHIRRQRLYVESMACAGREIGLQFGLYALWEKSGRDVSAYRAQATGLLARNAAACRAAEEYFHALGKPKDWDRQYAVKARAIEGLLAEKM